MSASVPSCCLLRGRAGTMLCLTLLTRTGLVQPSLFLPPTPHIQTGLFPAFILSCLICAPDRLLLPLSVPDTSAWSWGPEWENWCWSKVGDTCLQAAGPHSLSTGCWAQGASWCWMPCRSNSVLSVLGLGHVAWKNVGCRQERSTFSFCPVLWHFWTAGAIEHML